MITLINKKVEFETSRQHYIGYIVCEYTHTLRVSIKISEVFKGNKKIGNIINVSQKQCIIY